RRGKVDVPGGSDHDAALPVEPHRGGEAAARLRSNTKVGKDLLSEEGSRGGETMLQPGLKAGPGVPTGGLDRCTATRVGQAHEGEVELQQAQERVGQTGRGRG